MKIKRTKNGVKVWLDDFPNADEIQELNQYGDFRLIYHKLDEYRGFSVLEICTPEKLCPQAICKMECPIKEWFYI